MTANASIPSPEPVTPPDPAAYRDLPPSGWPRLSRLLARALRRRCPHCGAGDIFKNWFSLKDACPRCGWVFNREEGYFLGGYAINLIVAEVFGLGAVVILLLRSDLSLLWQELIAVGVAIGLPILIFPFSRTLWMALDFMIDRKLNERRLRADEMRPRR